MTVEGYGYEMPRLIEMALNLEPNKHDELFVFDWLIYIIPGKEYNRGEKLSKKQKQSVYNALEYIENNMKSMIEEECAEEDLHEALSAWAI